MLSNPKATIDDLDAEHSRIARVAQSFTFCGILLIVQHCVAADTSSHLPVYRLSKYLVTTKIPETTTIVISQATSPLWDISSLHGSRDMVTHSPPGILRAIQPVHQVVAIPETINGIP